MGSSNWCDKIPIEDLPADDAKPPEGSYELRQYTASRDWAEADIYAGDVTVRARYVG